jgi:hypothetical protein
MIKRRATIAIMGGICALALALAAATPARAGNVAFLSLTGTNPACTFTAPCSDMGDALAAAGANGEIICLNKGIYGAQNIDITQSVTISCGGGLWEAPGPNLIVGGPAGTKVVIEGLVANAVGSGSVPVSMTGQGELHLRGVRIGGSSGSGLAFQPNGPASLHISDSFFFDNGGAAILIQPTASGNAQVTIDRTHLENSSLGIVVDGTSSSGTTNAFIRESVIAGINGPGVAAKGSTVSADRSQIVNNNFGVIANNGGSALLSYSTIQGNGTAFAVAGGAAIFSYGNNNINANGSFGSSLTVIGQH